MFAHTHIRRTLICQKKWIGPSPRAILEAEPLLITFHTAEEPIQACKWMLPEVFNPDKTPSVKELKNLLKYKGKCTPLKYKILSPEVRIFTVIQAHINY